MKRLFKTKNVILILIAAVAAILLACIVFSRISYGSRAASAASVDDNYRFELVDVDITVNDDKTMQIRERLEVFFKESGVNTGIIRDIQRVSKTTRVINGKTHKGKSYIAYMYLSEVKLDGGEAKVTESYYGGGNFYSVKMQKPKGYLESGVHTFELSYTYDMSDDKALGYDDFTFDILGYAMARTEKFTAKITFPEGTPLNDVSFRTNEKANWSPDTLNGEYTKVSGNVISVCAFPQSAEKGYTLQVILPDGYFNARVNFYGSYIVVIVAFALSLAGLLCAFFFYQYRRRPLKVVEYYPPEGVDIMQYSAIWHRGVRSKDCAALVLKWSDKGAIKIRKDGNRHLKLFTTGKVKDAENRSHTYDCFECYAERKFYKALFRSGTQFSTRDFRKAHSTVRGPVNDAVEALCKHGDDDLFVCKSANKVRYALPFIALVPTLAILVYYCTLLHNYTMLLLTMFMAVGAGMILPTQRMKILLMFIFPIFFYGMPYFAFKSTMAYTAYDYIGLLWVAPAIEVLSWVMVFVMRERRTDEGQRIYGQMLGFRDFLLKTELQRIQLLFDNNPEYFSTILPYCFIMGISRKVRKRFASLDFKTPAFFGEGIDDNWVGSCFRHSHIGSSSFSAVGSGGGSSGGGGGGGGGSSGGGGGGGGSRGC